MSLLSILYHQKIANLLKQEVYTITYNPFAYTFRYTLKVDFKDIYVCAPTLRTLYQELRLITNMNLFYYLKISILLKGKYYSIAFNPEAKSFRFVLQTSGWTVYGRSLKSIYQQIKLYY